MGGLEPKAVVKVISLDGHLFGIFSSGRRQVIVELESDYFVKTTPRLKIDKLPKSRKNFPNG